MGIMLPLKSANLPFASWKCSLELLPRTPGQRLFDQGRLCPLSIHMLFALGPDLSTQAHVWAIEGNDGSAPVGKITPQTVSRSQGQGSFGFLFPTHFYK